MTVPILSIQKVLVIPRSPGTNHTATYWIVFMNFMETLILQLQDGGGWKMELEWKSIKFQPGQQASAGSPVFHDL